jgi:hypothetical protein
MTTWTINPSTLLLESEDGIASRTFTGEQWQSQQWPPCPACGLTIRVTPIKAQTSRDSLPVYTVGSWGCLNGCDPRAARRRAEGTTP